MKPKTQKISLALLLGFISFLASYPFLSSEQSLLVATIVVMVTLWTNEGLPLAVVSLLPIVLFPSAGILSTKETTLNYAHPIIYLFLGGFLIAIAVEKSKLHQHIAQTMLNLFPSSPRGIIFALLLTSGLLSAILSNTTTALLLLPIALFLTSNKTLKMRFALAIAYGASIGGILTPIGTPPNLIFMGMLEKFEMTPIAFMQWVYLVAPLVFIMFIFVGFILALGLKGLSVEQQNTTQYLSHEQKKILTLIGGVIALLLINAPIKPYYNGLGLSEPLILLASGLLLFAPPFSILEWNTDKEHIPFRIMFLFGAGFAIASAFTHTGLASLIAQGLTGFTSLPLWLFLLLIASIVTFTTEITSNTALISIMLPILYSVADASGLDSMLIMMVATVCASYAFMLPIATPPNAIAMSSGVVSIKRMAMYGLIFNLIGIVLIVTMAHYFWIGAI